MEFSAAFFVEVSEHKLEFSTLIFPFYKMLFMTDSSFLVSRIFFVRITKTGVEYGCL
jgi:hypothetical protein